MGLFFGALGKQISESCAYFLDPYDFLNDFLKTKKVRNVRTMILAALSSHIEPYGPISVKFSWFP